MNEIFHENTDESGNPVLIIDEYAGPMDNLAGLYMKRNDYKNALLLFEKVLPLYRAMEILDYRYTFQRYYATEKIIECLCNLGDENKAMYYKLELKYLNHDVLPQVRLKERIEKDSDIKQMMEYLDANFD